MWPTYVLVNVGQRYGVGDVDATLVLLLEDNVGRLLVDADTETLEFRLDDALVGKGLVDIEDNADEMAGFCNGNDLSTSTLAVLGSLNDTGQVEDLEFSAIVNDLTGHRGKLDRASVVGSFTRAIYQLL